MPVTLGAKRLTRRRIVLAAGAAVCWGALAGGGASARADVATFSPVDLRIVDRGTGRVLPFWRQGRGRLFVAGEPGARYGLRVTNHTGGRVLLVLSVDGLNVLTGETAKYDQRGYVLDAFESYDVNGWRKSPTEIAAFTFTALSRSYAARTGRPDDVGVVGMAVFTERADPAGAGDAASPTRERNAPAPPDRSSSLAEPRSTKTAPERASPGAMIAAQPGSPVPPERLGTGHGAREWSSVAMVDFVRATSYPQSLRTIGYDRASTLLARGVTPPWSYPEGPQHRPRAFPSEPDGIGFVPDPPR